MNYKKTLVYFRSEMDFQNIRLWIATKPLLTFIVSFLSVVFLVQFGMQLHSHYIPRASLAALLFMGSAFAYYFSFVTVARWEFNRRKNSMTRLQRHLIKKDLRTIHWMSTAIVAAATLFVTGHLIIPLLF